MLCDSLQRHSLQIKHGLSETEAWEKAKILGNEWLIRNRLALQKIQIPYEISRWETWLQHPKYQKQADYIEHLYNYDEQFNSLVYQSVHPFAARNAKNHPDFKFILQKSIEYIKEECTVMPLWVEKEINYELYPGKRNPAMEYVYQRCVANTYPNLLNWKVLRFKKTIKPIENALKYTDAEAVGS